MTLSQVPAYAVSIPREEWKGKFSTQRGSPESLHSPHVKEVLTAFNDQRRVVERDSRRYAVVFTSRCRQGLYWISSLSTDVILAFLLIGCMQQI